LKLLGYLVRSQRQILPGGLFLLPGTYEQTEFKRQKKKKKEEFQTLKILFCPDFSSLSLLTSTPSTGSLHLFLSLLFLPQKRQKTNQSVIDSTQH
jgi:hypothetical protein